MSDTLTEAQLAPIIGEVKTAVGELKSSFEGQFKPLAERIEQIEAKGQSAADERGKLAELFDRMEAIEAKGVKAARAYTGKSQLDDRLSRTSEGLERKGMAPIGEEAKAAFWDAARYGLGNISDEAKGLLLGVDSKGEPLTGSKAMTVGNQSTGGFLAPSEFVAEIIKGVVEFSPIRELAKVRQTSSKSSLHPVRTSIGSGAVWENENSTTPEGSGPKYGMIEIPNHKLRAWVVISAEDLEDPVFDMEAELREGIIEDFATTEGASFASGDGNNKPEGLWYNSDVPFIGSGSAGVITADQMRRALYTLKEPYTPNLTWLMRRATLGEIAILKDGQGNYLYNPGIEGTVIIPNIMGRPVRQVLDAPALATNAYPVVLGDIRKGYVISDRVATSLKRDEFSNGAAENDNVNFWARKRVGGKVVLPEALLKLKAA